MGTSMQKTLYFAGELFSQKHLIGNALLAHAIYEESQKQYLPILPQDLEFRDTSPKAIRDQDLLSLIQCDLALFHFDGPELDSGTVVEFMYAKFADIPAVILRTDFREGGDQAGAGDPWNLMCSFYPRTEVVISNCLDSNAAAGHQRQQLESYKPEILKSNIEAQQHAILTTAQEVIKALNNVSAERPRMKPENTSVIMEHIQAITGFDTDETIFEKIGKKPSDLTPPL